MGYNQRAVNAIAKFEKKVSGLELSFVELRRFGSIRNALEVQIEEGDHDPQVVRCLLQALHALADSLQQPRSGAMMKALDELENAIPIA